MKKGNAVRITTEAMSRGKRYAEGNIVSNIEFGLCWIQSEGGRVKVSTRDIELDLNH